MEWTFTIAAIVAGLAGTVFAGWKSGRPKKDSLNARWVSWPLVTLLAGALLMLGLVHVASLTGVHAGNGSPGGIARPY